MGGKVFTVEMHHSRVDFANPGDNVGLNIKGLDKNNMPRSGDVMVYKKDNTLGQTTEFAAQMEVPHSLKSNEMAECKFQPQQPLVCDSFKNCEGLSRVAFMDGNGVVMLGKVVTCERKEEAAGGGKKK